MSAASAEQRLKCLLLPMKGPGVLVPNAMVAEIITQQAVRPAPGTEGWLLGTGGWRGTEIPLISFEHLCGFRDEQPEAAGRYVVLFSLEPDQAPAYYGVRIESLPRSETVDGGRLQASERAPGDPDCVAARGRLGERDCLVPDFDVLLARIRAALPDS